jgi:leucyl/phenylalanyl-tRNA--protein transferase
MQRVRVAERRAVAAQAGGADVVEVDPAMLPPVVDDDPDVTLALSAYVQGLFPMDDPEAQDAPLPFYRADPRAVMELDGDALEATRRRLRRSLARDPGWTPAVDRGFATTVARCALPRSEGGVWITPRLARLYGKLHKTGVAHSFELWDGDRLAAGILGVVLGRAAMLESMFHLVPHAGNVNLVRTLERLAAAGVELCDIQIASEHTRRLGAIEIPALEFERRLRQALRT